MNSIGISSTIGFLQFASDVGKMTSKIAGSIGKFSQQGVKDLQTLYNGLRAAEKK
jgi:hypothetical protein